MRLQQAFNKTLKRFNIRPQEVCNIASISSSQLSQWRNGKKDVSGKMLGEMLDALEEIDPKALQGFADYLCGKEPGDRKLSNKALAEELSKLADALRAADTSDSTDKTVDREKVAA